MRQSRPNSLLYLDLARGRHADAYTRREIHHEFFHVIDWRDDGKVHEDSHWAAMKPRGFKYGNGGRNTQNDRTGSILIDKRPGFMNKYSTTGVEEDKAEVFATMIVHWDVVADRAKRDEVVAKKVARMQTQMEEFSPAADKEFWGRVREFNRSKANR